MCSILASTWALSLQMTPHLLVLVLDPFCWSGQEPRDPRIDSKGFIGLLHFDLHNSASHSSGRRVSSLWRTGPNTQEQLQNKRVRAQSEGETHGREPSLLRPCQVAYVDLSAKTATLHRPTFPLALCHLEHPSTDSWTKVTESPNFGAAPPNPCEQHALGDVATLLPGCTH